LGYKYNFDVLIDQARSGIREVHFLPFNPVDKRTALTYIDSDGNWHRSSKGAPEQVYISLSFIGTYDVFLKIKKNNVFLPLQIITLCNCKEDVRKKVHAVIDKFAERGLRSLGVARQVRKAVNPASYFMFD